MRCDEYHLNTCFIIAIYILVVVVMRGRRRVPCPDVEPPILGYDAADDVMHDALDVDAPARGAHQVRVSRPF